MDSLTFCTYIFNKGHLDPMLCIIVVSSQYLDIPSLEDDTMFPQNVKIQLPIHMALYPRRKKSAHHC